MDNSHNFRSRKNQLCKRSNLTPQPLKPTTRRSRVVRRVAGITMSEIVLDHPGVAPIVGKGKTAGVPKHMRVNVEREWRVRRRLSNHILCIASRHLLPSIRNEQPRQIVMSRSKVSPDHPQLVTRNRMLRRERSLQAFDPHPCFAQVQMIAPQAERFTHAQAMPEHHQDQKLIALRISRLPRARDQSIDFSP